MRIEQYSWAKSTEKLKEMVEIIEQPLVDLMRRFPLFPVIHGYTFTDQKYSEAVLDKILVFNQRLKNPQLYFLIELWEFEYIAHAVKTWIDDGTLKTS